MQDTNQLLKQCNKHNAILAITSYPNPQDGQLGKREFSAVGWHSEKTLAQLCKHAPVVVLAEKREGPVFRKINDNLLVARVWKKGSFISLFTILKTALGLNKVAHVYVQFEFNVFGGILPNLFLLAVLAFLRLTGRRVTFELHQVITDISLLQKHINITNPLLHRFFDLGLKLFYYTLGIVANDIIVFEQELKNRLSLFVKSEKIQVLSLAVEPKKLPAMKSARTLTNLPQDEFIILVFGFINGYKGIDWIIEALKDVNSKLEIRSSKQYQNTNDKNTKSFGHSKFENSNLFGISDFGFHASQKPVRLLVAGGENPYLKDLAHYKKFYQNILAQAEKHPHITLTGFVPDDQIKNYFGACNVVVMPYEVFMSASGPFSLALSYGKPLLLSQVLSDYAQSSDFKSSLDQAGLTKKDIFFKLNQSDLIAHINRAQIDPSYLNQLTQFTASLALLRGSEEVTKRLYKTITSPIPAPLVLEEPSLSIN